MKRWQHILRSRAQMSLTITLSVAVGALILANLALWQLHAAQARQLSDIEPRIARLLGVQQALPTIGQALAEVRVEILKEAYPSTNPAAQIGTALQQRVRQILEQAQMVIEGSQTLPPINQPGYEVLPMNITAQGSLEALVTALNRLQEERPRITIQKLSLQPTRGSKGNGGQVLRLEARLSVLRLTE